MKMHLSPDDYKTAASNGIHKKLAYERFYNYGWSADRAITQKPERDLRKYAEMAVERNIPLSTFYHRVSKRIGWSLYKAATNPVDEKGEFMSVEEQYFGGAG